MTYDRRRFRRDLIDLVWSAGATAAALFLAYQVLGALPGSLALLLAFMPFAVALLGAIVFGGPAIIVSLGLLKGRFGIALGPIALFVLGPLAWHLMLALNLARVGAMTLAEPLAPEFPIETVILDTSGHLCTELCTQVLAQKNVDVVTVGGPGWGMWRFSRLRGTGCETKDNIFETLYFVAATVPETCAARSRITELPDGLIIRERRSDERETSEFSKSAFFGRIYEALERRDGRERLLARLFQGEIGGGPVPRVLLVPANAVGIGFHRVNVGQVDDGKAFYEGLLGITIEPPDKPSVATIEALLNQLDRLLRVPGYGADRAYVAFASAHQQDFPQQFRAHLPGLLAAGQDRTVVGVGVTLLLDDPDLAFQDAEIARLLRQGDPVIASQILFRIGQVSRSRQAAFAPIVLAKLQSSDPQTLAAALIAVRSLGSETQSDLMPAVLAVLFESALWKSDVDLTRPFIHTVAGVPPDDVSDKAVGLFGDSSLPIGQRMAGFAIVCKKAGRERGLALLLTRHGSDLAAVTIAVGRYNLDGLCDRRDRRWSHEEVARFFDRLDEIPAGSVSDYVGAVTSNSMSADEKRRLKDHLKARLLLANTANDQGEISAVTRTLHYFGLEQ
jgi:hypothetical protein